MTQEDLRRRWEESGALDDGSAYLREALKHSALQRQPVEIAAYLGSEVASVALEGRHPRPKPAREGESELFKISTGLLLGLEQWGKAACVGAALHLGQAAVPAYEDSRLIAALNSIRGWLDCPCSPHVEQVASAREASMQAGNEISRFIMDPGAFSDGEPGPGDWPPDKRALAALAVYCATSCAVSSEAPRAASCLAEMAWPLITLGIDVSGTLRRAYVPELLAAGTGES